MRKVKEETLGQPLGRYRFHGREVHGTFSGACLLASFVIGLNETSNSEFVYLVTLSTAH
jgi:hypothetical protein